MLDKFHFPKQAVRWLAIFFVVKVLVGLAALSFSLTRLPVFAQQTSDMPAVELEQVASGLARPVHITHAGDGSGRLFIVEQAGTIRILADGSLLAAPFLDISDRVLSSASGGGNEEGLLSVAFPPGYADKGYFYVYYTNLDGDNLVARFSVTGYDNIADPQTELQIIELPHPDHRNHNGGQMAFGPDGYLYIGTGDGGGGGDPLDNGQDPLSLNGKILRIDVEMDNRDQPESPIGPHRFYLPKFCRNVRTGSGAYRIPQNNPFVGDTTYRPEIWALGLRNPWRFSFDRQTGDLFIADVGQNRWEEINFQPADSPGGENYGWNIMEGLECYQADTCDTTGLTMPVYVYPIFNSTDCSVTGGFVYRGEAYPELEGLYIFGDFCSGRVWGLQQVGSEWQSSLLVNSGYRISTFGEDEDGELYLADLSGGGIYQIILP